MKLYFISIRIVQKGGIEMKFAKGMIMGGIITAGVLMMYADNNTGKKKIMKKGKQLARKMGIM